MALLYKATLAPSKIELLASWIPGQPWLGDADASALEVVGAFRFDDPNGEVGIETHLLRTADGAVLQVPVTYRSAPVAGAEASLVGTAEHSVLGPRWVYDGCADLVYANALAVAILTGGHEAALEIESDGRRERREATTHVSGSGQQTSVTPADAVSCRSVEAATYVNAGDHELVVRRRLNRPVIEGDARTLTGTWPGNAEPAVLAVAR